MRGRGEGVKKTVVTERTAQRLCAKTEATTIVRAGQNPSKGGPSLSQEDQLEILVLERRGDNQDEYRLQVM